MLPPVASLNKCSEGEGWGRGGGKGKALCKEADLGEKEVVVESALRGKFLACLQKQAVIWGEGKGLCLDQLVVARQQEYQIRW